MAPDDLQAAQLDIDRRRAEFTDPHVEARFMRHALPERNAQLKASLLFAAFFYVLFGLTDIATLGPGATAWMLMALRIGVALVALAGHRALARHPVSVRVSVGASCALLVAALAVFMVVCWFQPKALAWNTMSQALILMAVYVNFPNRFGYALAIGIGSSVVFAVMLALQGHLAPDDILTLAFLLILANALGYVACRRIQLAQREAYRSATLLQRQADQDPLTGCFNRRMLQEGLLANELTRARRHGMALSVILCDIDHFKQINDTHGHAAGDQVLRDFAALLRAETRTAIDSVIRYGGEEFLLVLPQTELAGALAVAGRIRAAFAGAVRTLDGGALLAATASFGVACVHPAGAGAAPAPETLIDAADRELYAVKGNGRNGVRGARLDTAHAPA